MRQMKERQHAAVAARWAGIEGTHRSGDDIARVAGVRLRAAREAHGWSLLDVQDGTGGALKASVLGAYERAERWFGDPDRLSQYARLLGVDLAWLFCEDGDDAVSAAARSRAEVIRLAGVETQRRMDQLAAEVESVDSSERKAS